MTKTNKKTKEELMKEENKAFNERIEIHKKIFEEMEKTFKNASEVMRRTGTDIFQAKIDDFTKEIKDLKKWNQSNYKKMMTFVKKIQLYNTNILKMILNEKDFKQFKEEGKISIELQGELKEEQKKIVENLNGQFITEKTLLVFPLWIEGGIKQDEVKLFQENFETLSKEIKKRNDFLQIYYQYQSRIILTNQQIAKMQDLFFEILPKYQEGNKETINLTEANIFELFSNIQGKINEAIIDEKNLFTIASDIESEYKISFVYDEKSKKTTFTFEKGINISGHIIDLSNPRIKELEKENEELKKKLEKKEEEEPEEIEILKDFKPIPIDKQITITNKLAMIGNRLTNGKWAELTNQGGKSKKMKNFVEKVFVENGEMKTSKPLTDFDILILDTIYTLTQENKYFDIQMIKKHLIKREERHRMKLDDDIEESIEKLRVTFIEIQSPSELKKTYKKPFDKMGIRETILPLREFYVIKGGKTKKVFSFTNISIYFLYAEAKGQLMTKEPEYLEVKIGKKGKNELVLINKISTRVKDMKRQRDSKKSYNGKEYIDSILFDYLLENLDYNEENIQELSLEAKKQRYLKIAEKILNDYRTKKLIKSFKMESNCFKFTLYTQGEEKRMQSKTK